MFSKIEFDIGLCKIGGNNPIIIQSMCNTKTVDIEASIRQINTLCDSGCDMVRLSVPDHDSAKAIGIIKKSVSCPIIADIHFNYRLAIESIKAGVDKIRINPGNMKASDIDELSKVILDYNIPVRVGVNSGSIESRFKNLNKWEGLAKSCLSSIKLLEDRGVKKIVASLKSSDVIETIKANEYLKNHCDYPIHLGVTEAGLYEDSIIKSSIGIGHLLYSGIGDTIRVSITGDPKIEIDACRSILNALHLNSVASVDIVACPTCARTEIDIELLAKKVKDALKDVKKNIKVAVMGCVVNGIGEGESADIGVAGGKDKSVIFKAGKILKTVRNEDLVLELLELIEKL